MNHRALVLVALPIAALAACTPSAPAPSSTSGAAPAGSAAAPAATGPHYGAVMAELGHRFEMAGRAAAANRFELAEFEVGEIEEIFEDDLPHAALPKVNAGANLVGQAEAFAKTSIPALAKAAKDKDRAAFTAAFTRAAETCNACHKSSGHAFIEIPSEPGAAVPKMDPLPAPGK